MDEYIGLSRPLKVVHGNYASLDARYGPYDSINHAISGIPISIRRIGLTVGIISVENSVETVEEYWWKRGIEDSDLELKITGSSVSYERLDTWNDYDSSKSGWVLSALLGFDLNTRVSDIEENAALSLSYLGNGNGIANIIKTGATLNVTKANFAELDESGKIPLSLLPPHEDEVLEYNSISDFPSTGKSGVLYINKGDNKLYRWNNISYIAFSNDVSAHTHTFASLTGKPTTISGYGILDAYTKAEIDTKLFGLTTNDFYSKTEVDTKLNLKLNKSVFDDLFQKVEISTDVYVIKAKYSFYSVGEVSAYGLGNGTGGEGGVTTLANLTDVSLTSPINGNVLVYNGTHWINLPQSEITPDLTGYATKTYVDGEISSHTHTFNSLTDKPTTLVGYGITDAASSSHTHTFESLTSKPTTLSGYGILDAYTKTEVNSSIALKLDKSIFEDLFEKVEVSTGVYAIKAKYNLYSVGEISAYNFGSETSEGSATVLSDLTDVSLTTVTNGDILIYNGTHWTNHPQSDIIPDITGYATEDYVDGLISTHTHTFSSLTLKPTTLSGYGITDAAAADHTHTFISITNRPTTLGGYGITDAALDSHTHTFASLTGKPTTLEGYGITDAATIGHVHSYLPLSGGTLSGNVLPSSSFMYSLGSSTQKWKEIHADSLLGLSSLNIGNVVLKYNSTNNALYVEKQDGTAANFYATGEVSAYQFGSGSGATSYERLDTWSQYRVGITEGWVLSAALGKNLLDRVVNLESATTTGDKSYIHNQDITSNVWTVVHNLGKYPSVTAVDTANTAIVCSVRYINLNSVELTFTEAFSGRAFCN